MKPATAARAGGDDEPGGEGGHRDGGRALGDRRRGQDRNGGEGRRRTRRGSSPSRRSQDPRVAIAVTVEQTSGQGGTVAAPIAKQVMETLLGSGCATQPRTTVIDGRYRILDQRRLRRHGRRLLRGGHAPRPADRDQAAAPAVRAGHASSSSASAARRPRPPACSTRTSSASTTAASSTAPTTSRWSSARARSLKELIAREAPLDPTRAIAITKQILVAARFAHRRGVIHRDLKPQNVIIDAERRHVKVADFGIARAGALRHHRGGRDHGHGAVPLAGAGAGPAR